MCRVCVCVREPKGLMRVCVRLYVGYSGSWHIKFMCRKKDKRTKNQPTAEQLTINAMKSNLSHWHTPPLPAPLPLLFHLHLFGFRFLYTKSTLAAASNSLHIRCVAIKQRRS